MAIVELRPREAAPVEWLPYEGPVTADDRAMFEHLGCVWPDTGAEDEWLAEVNRMADQGSTDFRNVTEIEQVSDALQARRHLLGLFTAIDPDCFADTGNRIPLCHTMLGAFRALYSVGADLPLISRESPSLLTSHAESTMEKLDMLSGRGIDTGKILESGSKVLTRNIGILVGHLRMLYAASRMAGFEDYHSRAHRLVEDYPSVLYVSYDRLRFQVDYGRHVFSQEAGHQVIDKAMTQVIMPPERQVVAYIEHGESIRTPHDLQNIVRQYGYGDFDRDELRGWIADYSRGLEEPDPVVSAYLKAFPIDDSELVIAKYQSYHARRERLVRDYREVSTRWQGPLMLGSPNSPSAIAFEETLCFEPLDDDEQRALEISIAGANPAEEHEARMALVVRHLPLVKDIVDNCPPWGADDRWGIVNQALVEAVWSYGAENGGEEDELANLGLTDRIIVEVMRAIAADRPRYRDMSLEALEKSLGITYVAPLTRRKLERQAAEADGIEKVWEAEDVEAARTDVEATLGRSAMQQAMAAWQAKQVG